MCLIATVGLSSTWEHFLISLPFPVWQLRQELRVLRDLLVEERKKVRIDSCHAPSPTLRGTAALA